MESAVSAYLLGRSQEEGFEVFWWRERGKEVDFVIQKGSKLTVIEVKSGRINNIGGSLAFKERYPHAFSLIIGSHGSVFSLGGFRSGLVPLFI